jgi:chromosome segregation ATPase
MKIIRRILGVLVMIAGILGLTLSLAGGVMVWVSKPTAAEYAINTLETLNQSVSTSQNVMVITNDALGATIDSADALSEMLGTTAASVEDIQPVLNEFNDIMAGALPSTLQNTSESLHTASQAAQVLESTIQSLNTFRTVLSDAPLIGNFVEKPESEYNPDKPLAETLEEMATNLEGLPETFIVMSEDLSTTDEKLLSIQTNLDTMSNSVSLISSSLGEYQTMITQSQSSMDDLKSMITNIQENLDSILNWVAILLTLFFLWLLAAQVVIFSQGWELYQGTADRIEGEVVESHSDPETE